MLPRFDKVYPNGDEIQMSVAFFECAITGGALKTESPFRMQADEVLGLGWFDLNDLPPMQTCCAAKAQDAQVFQGEAFFR